MSQLHATPESLALSASLFTSQIASWIPADFGLPTTSSSSSSSSSSQPRKDAQDLIQLATTQDRNDRLGLGHPLAGVPSGQRGGGSLIGLGKRLGIKQEVKSGASSNGVVVQKRRGRDGQQKDDEEEDGQGEEEGEESRTAIVKKARKNPALDLLAGKKKKKKGSALVTRSETSTTTRPISPDMPAAVNPKDQSVQAGSADRPIERPESGNHATRDVARSPAAKHAQAISEGEGLPDDVVGSPSTANAGLSKSQRRRMKRKEKEKQKQTERQEGDLDTPA